jgi:hypothetical protein
LDPERLFKIWIRPGTEVPSSESGSSTMLKGLSHEIDLKNVDENGQILALLRAAAGFKIFRRLL